MSSPGETIKDLLVTAGVGTFAATSGWGIYVSKEPETPDTVITVYDTGGRSPNPKWLLDFPSVQVRVRGAKGEYQAAYAKTKAVRDELLGIPAQTINGDLLGSITMVGDFVSIGYDKENRPMFTMNFSLIMEPATSAETNRSEL